jgi:hypothetical protein
MIDKVQEIILQRRMQWKSWSKEDVLAYLDHLSAEADRLPSALEFYKHAVRHSLLHWRNAVITGSANLKLVVRLLENSARQIEEAGILWNNGTTSPAEYFKET